MDLTHRTLDLPTLAHLYRNRDLRPRDLVEHLLTRREHYADPAVWIHSVPGDELLAQADELEKRRANQEALPLYGVPFAVKDNIDAAGLPTTAACPAFRYVATDDSPSVGRLRAAGALLVGKTNLDQFGTGLAGDRSPYGACCNPFDGHCISGGSSSGSAVAVAAGLVSFALGTDTAGSGRVPAGCTNTVGLKPAPGQLSTEGVVPACRTLDCISIFALTAEDARFVFEVARERPFPEDPVPFPEPSFAGKGRPFTFALPREEDLEFCGDADQARLFAESVMHLEKLGGRRRPIDFRAFRDVAVMLYEGPWLAERYAGLESFLREHAEEVYPITRAILEGGARYRAADVFQGKYRLSALRKACLTLLEGTDLLVVPTMPTVPLLADVQADSVGWSRRLGHYTNFANLLNLAAVAVPAGFTPRGLPGGITLLAPAGSERRLCDLGMLWQRRLNLPLGATGCHLPEPELNTTPTPAPPASGFVRVAVAGAHLRGQPLHEELKKLGARFVRACRTAPRYRFFAFLDLHPPKPGLLRDEDRAGAILVETYDLPTAGFGALVASVAPPLAIGTVELADGEQVKGFLCESWPARRARDITDYGSWVAFRNTQRS